MSDDLNQDILALGQRWDQRTNAFPDRGVLGDANGVIVDPNLPLTNVLVRMRTSNGLSAGRSVILPASTRIPLTAGLPVDIGYNSRLKPIVLGIDTETQASTGVASQTSVQQNNSGRTQQSVIETLNIVAGGALTVNLKGWNVIANGSYSEFSYNGIDLASFVPSSGYECWAAVFVLSDLSGVETFASTPSLSSDFPDPVAEINECLVQASAGSTPAWAVRLTGSLASFDQTYLTNNVKDLRQMVNNADGTSYASLTTTGTTTTTIAGVSVAQLSAVTITGEFVASKSDYSASATGTFRYGVRRASGGNVTQIAAATISQDEDSSGSPALSLDVDTGTQTARIRAAGVAAETWYWKVSFKITKVSS